MVVFKRKTMPKDTFPPGLLVCVQEKGWVDNVVLAEWLEKVWFRRPGALIKNGSMLLWDKFRAHLTDQVKAKFKVPTPYQQSFPVDVRQCYSPLTCVLINLSKTKCANSGMSGW